MPLRSSLRRLAARWSAPQSPRRLPWPSSRPLPGTIDRRAGERYLHWFVELAGLAPDEAVLEPGCGTGRMAEPLVDYLSATGSYDGFDVVSEAIEWCETHIASKHPNFHFRHVDVLNPAFNPAGRLDPEDFEFPYQQEAFDFVFLTSVFTHMLPSEVRHYLSEIRRVLRPGGRCLMTFFLLNEESLDSVRTGRAERRFAHKGDGYWYDIPERPQAAVAYREEDVLGFLEQAGFELHAPILHGRWTSPQGPRGLNVGQDIVVVKELDAQVP